jgi:hypothetical protein
MKVIDASPFADAIVPEPGPKTSTYAGMGKPISDGPAPTEGQLAEVQYCDLEGGTSPLKIPGGGSY